jgi:hypothetical protein
LTFVRTHAWRTFLLAAVGINILAFLLARLVPRPQVEFGAALDVAVTVPALYFLLIVRAGLAPAISIIPLCLLGLLRATWIAPPIAFARPAVGAAVEIAIVAILVMRVRRGLRGTDSADVVERLEFAAREIVPVRRVAAILAAELAVFYYAFCSWRSKPDVRPDATAFTMHRQSGVAMLFGFLAGVSVMEAAVVHLAVSRWSAAFAWVLTGISIYGAIWLAALARSFPIRPVLVTEEELILRAGLLWSVRIPRRIMTVERTGAACDLRVPLLAEPNLMLRLSEPVSACGIYGITRRVTSIGIALDDPAAFQRLF